MISQDKIPCAILLLVYLTCLNTVNSFVPKDASSSHHNHNNHIQQTSDNDNIDRISVNISSTNTRPIYPINENCFVDATLSKVLCQGLSSKKELPKAEPYFQTVLYLEFVNISAQGNNIRLEDFFHLFPNVKQLSINHSPDSASSIIEKNRMDYSIEYNNGEREVTQMSVIDFARTTSTGGGGLGKRRDEMQINKSVNRNANKLIWESVKQLNLSWNELTSDSITLAFLDVFPNLEALDISHNFVSKINISLERLPYLKSMDISGELELQIN